MSISRRFFADNTVSTYPARSIAVNSSIDANLGVITFTLVSNLTPGLVLNYSLPNTSSTDFVEGNSGTLTVNGSGGATVVRTLNRYVNYSNTNISSKLSITSPAGTALVDSANFVIAPFTPLTFSGGTKSIVNVDTFYAFTTNTSITVTSLGDLTDSHPIRIVAVAGGGAGGPGGMTTNPATTRTLQRFSGAGGGGGGVLDLTLIANNFSLTTYNITIGQGGNANVYTFASNVITINNESVGKGGNTSITFSSNSSVFSNILAVGGGLGSSLTSIYANGGSGGGSGFNGSNPDALLPSPGTGIIGQGKQGGLGSRIAPLFSPYTTSIFVAGGGGGGNATVGANGSVTLGTEYRAAGGNGGNGYNAFGITGSNVYYSGGGGGGLGYALSAGPFATIGIGGSNSGGDGGNGGDGFTVGQDGKTYGGGGGGGGARFYINPNYEVKRGGNGKEGILYIRFESQFRVLKPA